MEFSDIDRTMMARCIELARRGAAEGEHPFGSVIANGAEVIAEASNRTVRDRDESRHAEILAIAQARKILADAALARCTLYSIIEPCPMCSFCIRAAGIRRVVFALHSPVMGGLSKWNILGDRGLSRRIPCLFRGPSGRRPRRSRRRGDAGVERLAAAGDAGDQAVRFFRQAESRQDQCGRAVACA